MKLKLTGLILIGLVLVACNPSTSSMNEGSSDSSQMVSSTASSSENIPATYANPVWEPVLADPSIIRGEDNMFYAFGTQDNALWGDYYGVRYIPILSSPNLVDWTYADAVFKPATLPTWNPTSGAGLWAPDIVKIGESYLLYYSLSAWGDPNPGIGVALASDPVGPWVDQGKLFDSNEIGVVNSIDPAVFVDEDDRVYMIWGSFAGIYAVELTSDGLALKDGTPALAKENKILLAGVDNRRWESGNYEGAYLVKTGNWYYLYLSTGSCCSGLDSTYEVRVARSESVLGPYYDKAGNLMTSRQNIGTAVVRGNNEFVGVGHNSVIMDDAGNEWLVYHGFDKTKSATYGNTNRRTLLIDKLIYDDDLWPSVQGKGASRGAERPTINV